MYLSDDTILAFMDCYLTSIKDTTTQIYCSQTMGQILNGAPTNIKIDFSKFTIIAGAHNINNNHCILFLLKYASRISNFHNIIMDNSKLVKNSAH